MNERILNMARAALEKDTYPEPMPEACGDASELRDPLAIARGIRRYLLKQPIDIRPGELLVDRYRTTGCAYPSDYYRSCGHDSKYAYWSEHNFESHTDDIYYWGWTHVSLDYGYVLKNGLKAYMRRAAEAGKRHQAGSFESRLLEGMRVCLSAVQERMALIERHALDKAEANPGERDIYLSIARNVRIAPMEPATTFYEAVQAVWTLFLIAPGSLGRIDQYLYPFYARELGAGTLTRERAGELIGELFVKVHESLSDNRALPISGHNHLVVGGTLNDGSDGYNELSELVLTVISELPTFRPQASFRYTRFTSAETMRSITECNRRCPLIVFVNDEARIKGMINSGISREDAIEYTVLGCNEWAICGKSELDLAHINMAHALTSCLFECRAEALAARDFDELYELFEDCLSADMRYVTAAYADYAAAKRGDINVLTSAFMDDCISNARPFNDGGARYHGLTLSFNGIPNVTDSLSVIREYVYDKRLISLGEFVGILEADWAGAEELRARILKTGRFFGNDDRYADGIAARIVDSVERARQTLHSDYANIIVCGSFVGATHPNIVFGGMTRATPDGRRRGEELTMGISQTGGRDRNGITALLKSIAGLDYSKLCGCLVSNLKIDPLMADTPEKLEKLSQMFHTFLGLGGMQLQINYISNEELIEALKRPEDYANLMVRVTGYSGYFTIFDRSLQDDIIKRTVYSDG